LLPTCIGLPVIEKGAYRGKRARNRNTKAMDTKESIRSGVRLRDEKVGVNHRIGSRSSKT